MGVYAETQFKNQREGDLTSDHVNCDIFNDWESHEILREANIIALNALTLDIAALMDVPEINHHWYQ